MLTFSLQSGSNGNAIYVETAGVRLLFDAGISGRQARERMASHDRNIRDVDAVILSHRHSDHTRAAGVYQRLFGLPLYATPATRHAIAPQAGKLRDVRLFQPGDTLDFGRVIVYTLPTPHDAAESVAFIVQSGRKRLGILTDLGHPFAALASVLGDLDAAYLESNYDPQMLDSGSYPPELKARIRGAGGHLSNDEAATLLKRCRRHHPRWVALAHLSEENNHPDLALQTHRAVLGGDFPLTIASRYHVSEALTLQGASVPLDRYFVLQFAPPAQSAQEVCVMSDQPQLDPYLQLPSSQMYPAFPERKHSGLGIASFILALALGVIMFLLFCVAGYFEAATPGGLEEKSPQAVLIGFGIVGTLAITLIGLVLGIVGLVLPNRKKGFAIAGVIINGCVIAGTIALIAIGLSAR